MISSTELWYRLKKAFALYPGVRQPVSGRFLAEHYRERRRLRSPLRAAVDAVTGLGFLAWVPLRALAVQRRFGLDDAWRRRSVAIARERFADPNDIALFRIEHADQLDTFIRRYEDAGLNKLINPRAWAADCVLVDKIAFYERCAAADLRHPEVIATLIDGKLELRASPRGRQLLIKPARGEGGSGVRILAGTPPEAPAAFAAWLRAEVGALRHSWVIQERVANHPQIADLALNALATARIVTIVNEQGEPEVVNSVLRMPADPAMHVDNMKSGGLLCPVELDSGTLGIACKGYGGSDTDVHPVTGAAIRGSRLPDWEAAQALAVDAHQRAFADYVLIGWDVGFSPDGPVLIEGNGKPSLLLLQRAWRRGLGSQRHGQLLAWHLTRAAAK